MVQQDMLEKMHEKIVGIAEQVVWMLHRFIFFRLTDTLPSNAAFSRGQRVEIWKGGAWYPATVTFAHDDETFDVIFDEAGWWGAGEQQVRRDKLRDLPECVGSIGNDMALVPAP